MLNSDSSFAYLNRLDSFEDLGTQTILSVACSFARLLTVAASGFRQQRRAFAGWRKVPIFYFGTYIPCHRCWAETLMLGVFDYYQVNAIVADCDIFTVN